MADFKRAPGEPLTRTFVAAADVVANRFLGYDDKLALSGAVAKGVVRDDVSSGKVGDVILNNLVYVTAEDNLSAGGQVASGATGKSRPAVATDVVLGRAFEDTNSGETKLVLLDNEGIKA